MTKQPMHRIPKWWSRTQWIVIPTVVLLLIEVGVRYKFDETPLWYGAAARAAAAAPVDVIFVGSSRVREGVYVPVFESEVFRAAGSCPRAINLARGYTTAAEHYLGLRNLFAAYPESMEGVTVFIEAPGGLPPFETWKEPWANASQVWLIADLLRVRDFPAFWQSGHSLEDKLRLSFRASLQNIAAVNRRERVRADLQQGGVTWIAALLDEEQRFDPFGENIVNKQLLGSGGTLTDEKSVRFARELAVEMTDQALRDEKPLPDWDTSIARDTVKLVQKHKGQVVFFDVPLSETFKRVYATPLRQRDVASFKLQAKTWGTEVLQPVLAYTDEDLPDLWHARKELSVRFSTELARLWAKPTSGLLTVRSRRQCPSA